MLSINTNLSSLIAQQSMSSATNKLNQAIERMTTGYKINGAKDNAANYSISTNMTTKINSYMVAEDNVAMGLDMLSTANGSLDQISDKLTRLRALATQAANGTYGQQSLTAINSEANALVDEINRLYSTAEYNGKKIFGGNQTSEPAVATYGMARTAATGGPGSYYTDEEIAAMTTLTEAYNEGNFDHGDYSINSLEELEMFRDLVNSDQSGNGANFVLTTDLDLSSISNWDSIGYGYYVSFDGTFDGNGHVISGLTINSSDENEGLFGNISGATIKNLGLENVNIKGGDSTGGLVGYARATTIENCYVTGSVEGSDNVGGLVGLFHFDYSGVLKNNYTSITVNGSDNVGGLCGWIRGYTECIVSNNFSVGNVSGNYYVGGLFGYIELDEFYEDKNTFMNNFTDVSVTGSSYVGGLAGYSRCIYYGVDPRLTIKNSYTLGNSIASSSIGGFVGISEGTIYTNSASVQADNNATQMTAEEIAAIYTPEMMGFTEENGWTIVNGQPVASYSMAARNANGGGGLSGSNYVTLQVGINADSYSQIGLEFGFALDGIEGLRQIGLDTSTDYLSTLDNMLDIVSAKATEYGAAQNRLESALDEIAIQYDNLVSSRSTLRDADIAEVSSQYIQQQILQQASATLLATANQSPSIALQLI